MDDVEDVPCAFKSHAWGNWSPLERLEGDGESKFDGNGETL